MCPFLASSEATLFLDERRWNVFRLPYQFSGKVRRVVFIMAHSAWLRKGFPRLLPNVSLLFKFASVERLH